MLKILHIKHIPFFVHEILEIINIGIKYCSKSNINMIFVFIVKKNTIYWQSIKYFNKKNICVNIEFYRKYTNTPNNDKKVNYFEK